jgi:hypothetical protein
LAITDAQEADATEWFGGAGALEVRPIGVVVEIGAPGARAPLAPELGDRVTWRATV